ncbi:MAG: hypothetical protein EON60_00240 [Alphaproteobacteria bacterium]|nr:MAG: hypothetical protein EON60_00240 [Alphaproteobacteria bacterium]
MNFIKTLSFVSAIIVFFVVAYFSWTAIYSLFPQPETGAKLVTTVVTFIVAVFVAQISFFLLGALLVGLAYVFGRVSPSLFRALWAVEYTLFGIKDEGAYVPVMELCRGTSVYRMDRILPKVMAQGDLTYATRKYGKLVKLGRRKPVSIWLLVLRTDAEAFSKAVAHIEQQRMAQAS